MGLFGKQKGEFVAVFDVGSASVGGALVLIDQDAKPRVLHTVREEMPLKERVSYERFYSSMLRAFENVAEKLERKKGKQKVDTTACFFSSPWYAPEYGTSSIKKSTPFEVTEELLDNAIKKDIAKFEEEQKKRYEENGLGTPKIVEKERVHVSMNGYETKDFEKRETPQVDVSFFASVAPENLLDDITEYIQRHFHDSHIVFHTFPFASFIMLRDVFAQDASSFLFLDITGEITDVFFVEGGVPQKFATFPLGNNFILRALAEEFKVTVEEGLTLLLMYSEGALEEKSTNKIEKTLQLCAEKWKQKLRGGFENLRRGGVAPQKVFFVSDPLLRRWFLQNLKSGGIEQLRRASGGENKTNIFPMEKVFVRRLCVFEKGAPEDSFLSIEAAFLTHSQKARAVR